MNFDHIRAALTQKTKSPSQIMGEARAAIEANLPRLCQEILDWHDTGLLAQGELRAIAETLQPFATYDDLAIAEKLVSDAALRFVVARS